MWLKTNRPSLSVISERTSCVPMSKRTLAAFIAEPEGSMTCPRKIEPVLFCACVVTTLRQSSSDRIVCLSKVETYTSKAGLINKFNYEQCVGWWDTDGGITARILCAAAGNYNHINH